MRKDFEQHDQSTGGPTPGSASFGDLLRRYRIRAGLSQEQLAEKAQISAAAVSALERGIRRMPYRSTVSLLANALSLSEHDCTALEAARRSKRAQPSGTDTAAHLEVPRTSFVGRDADIAQIVALLRRTRLVTLTGSGGIGKTRAAIEAAQHLAGNGWDKVWFVDLAPLHDGVFIVAKIASAIRPPLTDRVETIAALASALATRSMLLILDNCEHLVDDVAAAVHTILATCPQISILATSRERLNIAGEFVYRLQSLSVPETTPDRLEDAHAYSAVDLFVQRAEAADPRITFCDANVDAIVRITRRLDGIPLAIELAAAQLPTIGLRCLQERLEQHFNISAGRRDLPPRQQTLAATIAWSYDLLSEEEREILSSVAIFSGGFTLEAAETVCTADTIHRSSILPLLSSLVNKSLVNVVPVGEGVRYALLDSVRSFGLERLRAADKETSTCRRHAQWVAAVADEVVSDYHQPQEGGAVTELIPEFDNVRAAIVWSLGTSSQDDRGLAGWIIPGLYYLWSITGRRKEHRHWVDAALERLDERQHPLPVALLLETFIHRAHYEVAVLAAIDRAIPLFERIGNPPAEASLHALLTCVFAEHGKLTDAEQSSERALALMTAERMQQSHHYASFLLCRSMLRIAQGRLDDARADVAAAETLAIFLGDPYFVVCRCSPRLFQIEYAAGNTRRALEVAEQMLASDFGTTPGVRIQALEAVTALRLLVGDVDAGIESARELLGPMRCDQDFAVVYPATAAALRGHGAAASRLKGFVEASDARVPVRREAIRQATYDLLCCTLEQHVPRDVLAAGSAQGALLTAEAARAEALALLNLALT